MTGTEWLVVIGGAAAIAWVNWYFFLAQRATATAASAPGPTTAPGASSQPPEVAITVRGGYSPSAVRVKAGRPMRLVFDRQETSGCSEEVVLPDFGIRRFLPSGKKTAIEVTPPKAGRYEFTCGMSMLRGTLIAEE
jgi:plastocyanin domain-containing protein